MVTKSGGTKASAVVAVAHILAHLIYQVLASRKPYQDQRAHLQIHGNGSA